MNIVDRIGAFVAAVRVTRICAECESGISTAELERLLSGRGFPVGLNLGVVLSGRLNPICWRWTNGRMRKMPLAS
jgi:hypothetical protein